MLSLVTLGCVTRAVTGLELYEERPLVVSYESFANVDFNLMNEGRLKRIRILLIERIVLRNPSMVLDKRWRLNLFCSVAGSLNRRLNNFLIRRRKTRKYLRRKKLRDSLNAELLVRRLRNLINR